MELVLLIIQLIVALLLIGFVLVQRSNNDGFGMGSGGGGGILSSRGQANFMTRATSILAFVFMANSLLLTILTTQNTSSSLIDDVVKEQPLRAPTDGKNDAPALPLDPQGAAGAVDGNNKGVFNDATKDAQKAKGVLSDAVKGKDDVTVQPGAIEVSPQTIQAPKAE